MATTTKKKKQQPQQEQQQIPLVKQARATLTRLEEKDPGLKRQLEQAAGYAVFPSVGKASLVVGGSYGRGAVFERGNKLIGYATITQLTLGVQLGGDTFSEVVLLNTPEALERFKAGHMAFAANASTVLVKAGASATSNFKGVKTLAYSRGGMLLELAIGGQKFKFRPLGGQEDDGGKSGGGQSKSAQGGGASDEEASDDSEGGAEGGGAREIVGRAVGGVREAASKVTGLAKEHPVLAGFAAAGIATGIAVWVIRSVRSSAQDAGNGGGGEESSDEGDDESSDEAQGELQDEGEGGEDAEQDDGGRQGGGRKDSRNGALRRARARA